MNERHLDHIDLRASNLDRAFKFYRKLLPQLGFTCDRYDSEWGTFYSAGGNQASDFFGFTEDRNHQPNGTRIAFWAETRDKVDRIAKIVRQIDGENMEG